MVVVAAAEAVATLVVVVAAAAAARGVHGSSLVQLSRPELGMGQGPLVQGLALPDWGALGTGQLVVPWVQ